MEDKKEVLNEEELKEKTKKISIKDGSAYAVSDGLGIRYISPYALALGANNTQIGLLTSLPSLLGNFSQLFTHKALERMSRRKVIFYGALFQALMWIPVILLGLMFFVFNVKSGITPTLLILVYSLLILSASFYGPAWNSLMRDVVTEKSGHYFGVRNRIIGIVALISFLVGGFILDYFNGTKVFIGFIILFFIAFVARMISAFLILKKYEPKITYEKEYY
ncbi:MFS transporter, partial [Candidatus Pacearchaeota archaeon]|nr:MFS transporter [Candidatus Pacearchaeota archaeon]